MEIEIIKEKYNSEIALLVLCCSIFLKTADKEQLADFITANNINWKKVYDLSAVHRIRPVVFNVLFPVKELVEEDAFQLFRSFCMSFSSRIFSRKAESDRIIHLLQQHGIRARLYKGLDFAMLVYKDFSLRESIDMDVIIDAEDVRRLIPVLKSEGYEMLQELFYKRFPVQYQKLYKDVCFYKAGAFGGTFSFEFHFRPAIWAVSTSFSQLLGNDYLSPGRKYDHKDYLTLMLINNGVSDYFPTLRSVLDFAFLNPDQVSPDLQRFDQFRMMLSGQLFNLPVNCGLNYTGRFLLNELLSRQQNKQSGLFKKVYLNFRSSDTLRLKWIALAGPVWFLITPNSNDITAIRLPYYFLYYFIKPFRLIRGLFYNK